MYCRTQGIEKIERTIHEGRPVGELAFFFCMRHLGEPPIALHNSLNRSRFPNHLGSVADSCFQPISFVELTRMGVLASLGTLPQVDGSNLPAAPPRPLHSALKDVPQRRGEDCRGCIDHFRASKVFARRQVCTLLCFAPCKGDMHPT